MNKIERVKRTLRCMETDQAPIFDSIRNDKIIEFYGGGFPEVGGPRTREYVWKAHNEFTDAIKGFVKLPNPVEVDGTGKVVTRRWTSWAVKPAEYDFDAASQKAQEIMKSLQEADQHAKEENEKDLAAYDALCRSVPDIVPFHCLPSTGAGLYHAYNSLGGVDHFIYLYHDNEDLACSLLEACFQHTLKRIRQLPADYDPIAVLEAEDIAYKSGTILSPEFLRKNLFPRLKEIFAYYVERDIPVIFHSDGDLQKILPDLIDCGITGNHPIEVLAGMNVRTLRERYPRLVMLGGIDCSQLLPFGTPEEVYDTVRQTLIDSKGYGYFPGSSSEINNEVPLENAMAFKEAVESLSCS